jgi:PQQ-like domain
VGGELARLDNCRGFGGGAVTRVGPGAVAFMPCSDGILQVTIGPDDRLTRGWQARGVTGSPVLVGSTVWALDRSGTLHGLDAASGQERVGIGVGAVSRFATPAVSGGALFVPTTTGITAVALRP